MTSSRNYSFIVFILFLLGVISSCHDTTYVQGKRMYDFWCANCHMEDGTGLVKVNPPVAQSDWLEQNQSMLPCLIRNGANDTMVVNGVIYHHEMIAFPQLSDIEITNIINYMNHAWGNNYGERNINEVKAWLKVCE